MKHVNRMALAALMVAMAGAPALAETDDKMMSQPPVIQESSSTIDLSDAFETQVPPLTYSEAEDRLAAITYMDDALKLIDLGEAAIRSGDMDIAHQALMGASGKLSTAYLLNFRDRSFSRNVAPIAMRVATARRTMDENSKRALESLGSIRTEVASIGTSQLAMMGGGGGAGTPRAGYESLEVIGVDDMRNLNDRNVPTDEMNVPDEEEQ